MELVHYDVWRNHILCVPARLSLHDPSALPLFVSVRGLAHACRWGRALVTRALASFTAGAADELKGFVALVFRDLVRERFLQHAAPGLQTQLDRINNLVRHAPPPLLIHMWLWHTWYHRCEHDTSRAFQQALALRARHDDAISAAEARLAKREKQLREGVFGVHRPTRLRGDDDKEWTQRMRDQAAHEVEKLRALPRDELDSAVVVTKAAHMAMLDEPRAWLQLNGCLGRLHLVNEWEDELKKLRWQDYEARVQQAQLARKRERITGLTTAVEEKIARLKG